MSERNVAGGEAIFGPGEEKYQSRRYLTIGITSNKIARKELYIKYRNGSPPSRAIDWRRRP
jgi:hypothetical protein